MGPQPLRMRPRTRLLLAAGLRGQPRLVRGRAPGPLPSLPSPRCPLPCWWSRVAAALGISWHTTNTAILTRAEQILNETPDRFEGVEVLGVDEAYSRGRP